jgi:hypothetical protein
MTTLTSRAEPAAKARRRLITIRPWQRQWLWWMTYLCIGSGIGIFILKYLIEQDPFSMWNHPSQPWIIALHLITSPILILVIGSLMVFHVIPHFRERDHFWSGNLALASFAVYSITGMFLFFLFPEEVIFWIKWIHTVSGIMFLPILGYHWWVRYEPKNNRVKR